MKELKLRCSSASSFTAETFNFVNRTPVWLKEFFIKTVALLGLQDFQFDIRYCDEKTANRTFKKLGYAPLPKGARGGAHVDSEYLTAGICLIRPMKNAREDKRNIAHELLHVAYSARTFDRVKRELTNHYIDPDYQTEVHNILLSIEETTIEHALNYLDRLGFFD